MPLRRNEGRKWSLGPPLHCAAMAVHFIHISKTAGTAVRHALNEAGRPMTRYGQVQLHRHAFKLPRVPEGDYAFFTVRDPVDRFVSSFYSRLRQGAPRYDAPWTRSEKLAFKWFQSPQALGDALAGSGRDRDRAEQAMNGIRHINRPHSHWLRGPKYLRKHAHQIVFIARQEQLAADWEQLKVAFELPPDLALPTDPVRAHRSDPTQDKTLSPAAQEALREWYGRDYRLLAVCDELRANLPVLN